MCVCVCACVCVRVCERDINIVCLIKTIHKMSACSGVHGV